MIPGLRSLLAACAGLLLCACSLPEEAVIPENSPRIALVPFSLPRDAGDLLAGNLPPDAGAIDPAVLFRLDQHLNRLLGIYSEREFISREETRRCLEQNPRQARRSAFDHWIRVGECLRADLLLMPQALLWREEDPAEGLKPQVTLDIFLLDVNKKALLARSRYDAGQAAPLRRFPEEFPLSEEPSAAGRLGLEGLFKAIREFGL